MDDFKLDWHSLIRPKTEGFYLVKLEIVNTDKRYYDIFGYKDGRWKYRSSPLVPVDINDINHKYNDAEIRILSWAELPDTKKNKRGDNLCGITEVI